MNKIGMIYTAYMTDFGIEILLPVSITEEELEENREFFNDLGMKKFEEGISGKVILSIYEYPNRLVESLYAKADTDLSKEDWIALQYMIEKMEV